MKALIFNSGLGSRMGKLTKNNPKCLVKLYNGETILERQIRILSEFGIKEFIITTGPYENQIKETVLKYKNNNYIFVKNDDYLNTNYIVSMNNAFEYLDDDFILLHGDLVFNRMLVKKVLDSKEKSLCLYNENKELPEKDFKGRFMDGLLKEVSINIFDKDCYAFQPLYKLDKDTLNVWKCKVREFVEKGIVKVYAENALNEISNNLQIVGMSYSNDYIDEIDNELDYKRVSNDIKYFDYREQNIIETTNYVNNLKLLISENDNVFIVCGNMLKEKVSENLSWIKNKIIFSDFCSNPKYDDIKKGLHIFKNGEYNKIISIGGGSSIDVAKCIKLFSSLDNEYDFLESKYNYNNIVHIAIPTTAGTGSESTEISVMYFENKKTSISHGSILPDYAILDCSFLNTLSDYQKKSTLLDALCQSIESYWSKGATNESRQYAKESMECIISNYENYINKNQSFDLIMKASNLSGKAINISRTTAPHSMSYILSQKYGISHGHAVALCLIPCWKKMNNEADIKLKKILTNISEILKVSNIDESIILIENIINSFNLPKITIDDTKLLAENINIERMENNPIVFDYQDIIKLYENIYK